MLAKLVILARAVIGIVDMITLVEGPHVRFINRLQLHCTCWEGPEEVGIVVGLI